MRKIKLNFESMFYYEGKEEIIHFNVDATEIKSDKYKIISYIEPDKEASDRTLLKINDDEFILMRTGSIQSEICFRKQGESFGLYEVQGMSFKLEISLRGILIKENEVRIEYDLAINNVYSGLFKLKFEFAQFEEE